MILLPVEVFRTNIRPQARQPGTGAVREGCALLQGLAACGTCGRKLAIFYGGQAKCVPNYYCQGSAELVNGRGARHMSRRAGSPRGRLPCDLTDGERAAILALGDDLGQVREAPTTTGKDRKQLLRTLLDEVNITLHRDNPDPHASLILRWKGGAISELTVPLGPRQPKIRTSEDTISLIRRLAAHYPDAQIAGILNRQHRTTARGLSFTVSRVASLRTHRHIPCHKPGQALADGELLNVTAAARELKTAPSTLLRWLNDGFVAGEQITPWRALADPPHQPATGHAHRRPSAGSPSPTPPKRSASPIAKVKRGELRAVLTRTGRRKGLRIELPAPQDGLF